MKKLSDERPREGQKVWIKDKHGTGRAQFVVGTSGEAWFFEDDSVSICSAEDEWEPYEDESDARAAEAHWRPLERPPKERRRDALAVGMTAFELTVKDVLLVLMADPQLHPQTTMEELVETAMNTAGTLFDALEATP